MYFFEKDHLSFSVSGVRSYLREKEIWSFSIIQERSYSSEIFLERPSFQDVWKKKIWFSVQCYYVSDIQVYIEYIIKKYETLTTIPPIPVYINSINIWLVFKIKDGYKLELQTPETMKLFGRTKKSIEKIKNEEKVPSLEVVEVVLVQFNLVDDKYQQKSEVLYSSTPNNSCSYLLNAEPSNFV